MKRFRISFIVVERDVATIFSVLSGHASDFHVDEVKELKLNGKHKEPGYLNDREKQAMDAIAKFVKTQDAPLNYNLFKPAVKSVGLNPNSTASIVSKMVAVKRLVRVGRGLYELPK
jgi:hypothetical protein